MKLKKGTLLFLLLTCLAYTTLAQTDHTLKYEDLVDENGMLTIDDDGMITACGCTFDNKSIIIPEKIGDITITGIGDYAFKEKSLVAVVFEEGSKVTTIGNFAFWNNEIATLTLPTALTTIENYAFPDNNITTLTFPEDSQLTTIGSNAFRNNPITELTLPTTVTTIGSNAFRNNPITELTLPTTVTTIGSNAFEDNKITELTFPDDSQLKTIEGGAFRNNPITELILPTTVTTIGSNAFWNNEIATLTFPEDSQLTTIGSNAFRNNPITELTLPTALTTIGNFAFRDNNITTLTFPEDSQLTTIGSNAFRNNPITELILPTTVTTIGSNAFEDNKITELTFPEDSQLTTIGKEAFRGNEDDGGNAITELSLPATLTTIGASAFKNNSLTSVTFVGDQNNKSMIRSIGINAFKDNSTLTTITLPPNGNNNFGGYRDFNGGEYSEGGQITDFTLGYNAFIPYTLTAEDIDVDSDKIITKCHCDTFASYDISIPASITKDGISVNIVGIGLEVFQNKQLASVVLPEGLISIGRQAFSSNFLITLILPRSLKYIGANAFYNNNLTAVTFDGDDTNRANIISIGHEAFSLNSDITSINLPSHVQGDDNFRYKDSDGNEYVEGAEFTEFQHSLYTDIPYILAADDIEVDADGVITKCYCDNFDSRTITIPTTITKSGSEVTITGIVDKSWPNKGVFEDKTLAAVTFQDGSQITSIGNGAFNNNPITELTLPTVLTSIGSDAFSNNSIETLTIPEDSQLTTIGKSAFFFNKITKLTFPDHSQLATIGEQAFLFNKITKLTFPDHSQLTTIGKSAFFGNKFESFTLPMATKEGFRTYWQDGDSKDLGTNLTIPRADFKKSFELVSIEQVTLTTAVAEQQGGTISATPKPSLEDNQYDIDTEVELTAKPNEGWKFDKWVISDEQDKTDEVTTITLDKNKSVTAHFVKEEAITSILTEVVSATPYPNPVTSQITLKAKDGDLIQLFSQKGKQQYSTQYTGNEVHTIDVSTLPVGVYLVRITDAEGNTTTKRILKK